MKLFTALIACLGLACRVLPMGASGAVIPVVAVSMMAVRVQAAPAPAPGPDERKLPPESRSKSRNRRRRRSRDDDDDTPGDAAVLPMDSTGVPAAATLPAIPPAAAAAEAIGASNVYQPPEWVTEIAEQNFADEEEDPVHWHSFEGMWDDVMRVVMPHLSVAHRGYLMRALMYIKDFDAYEYVYGKMLEFELKPRRELYATRKEQAWERKKESLGEAVDHFLMPEDIEKFLSDAQKLRGKRVASETLGIEDELAVIEEEFREQCASELKKTCKKSQDFREKNGRPLDPAIVAALLAGGRALLSKKKREEDGEEEDSREPPTKKQRGGGSSDSRGDKPTDKSDPAPDHDGTMEG